MARPRRPRKPREPRPSREERKNGAKTPAERMKIQKKAQLKDKELSCPLSIEAYESLWNAFLEKQSVRFVQLKTGLDIEIVIQAIDHGWPAVQMPALSERLIKVRKKAQDRFDLKVAKRIAENANLTEGLRKRLLELTGEDFSKIKFKEGELQNLTVGKFKQLVEAISSLSRLEVFLLHDGTEHATVVHTGNVEHSVDEGASSKLSALAHRMNTVVSQIEKAGIAKKSEEDVIDADFSEVSEGEE